MPGSQFVFATSETDFGPFVFAFLLGAFVASGVGTKYPYPIPPMAGINGTSRNNKRLRFVTNGFQVSEHLAEAQCDDSRHVFTNNPSGPDCFDNAKH